jgi:hypothetical protein
MASMRFEPIYSPNRGRRWRAHYSSAGKDLPRGDQMTAEEMLKMKPGILGFRPRGVDQNVPFKGK